MFFIIFVLFFSQYFQANSLKCMTNEIDSDCAVSLDIGKPIPTDDDLTSTDDCKIDKSSIKFVSEGSCYAEVMIDYIGKTMIIKMKRVSAVDSFRSPYDDMFGILTDITSVVQYKINGNFDNDKLQMTTRIQCSTNDNCALEKLRTMMSNLTKIDSRKNIYKELKNFLNPSKSNPSSPLKCMDADDEIECSNDQDRCKFDRGRISTDKSCATADSNDEFNLEYRFNDIQEMSADGTDDSDTAFKCSYLCKTDSCNSDDNFVKVDRILRTLAMGSESKAVSPKTNNKNPTPQNQSQRKSNGVSLLYSQSMIIFFIQLLSN